MIDYIFIKYCTCSWLASSHWNPLSHSPLQEHRGPVVLMNIFFHCRLQICNQCFKHVIFQQYNNNTEIFATNCFISRSLADCPLMQRWPKSYCILSRRRVGVVVSIGSMVQPNLLKRYLRFLLVERVCFVASFIWKWHCCFIKFWLFKSSRYEPVKLERWMASINAYWNWTNVGNSIL